MQTQNRSLQSMLTTKKEIQKIQKKTKVKKKAFTIKAAPTGSTLPNHGIY